MLIVTLVLLLQTIHCFLLNDNLPQYNVYGKSLVLVGGNLKDNNSEIYRTIVEMAVMYSHMGCRMSSVKVKHVYKDSVKSYTCTCIYGLYRKVVFIKLLLIEI